MKAFSDGTCLFTVEEFKQACGQMGFMDDEGSGYYSIGKEKSEVKAIPSDFMKNKIDNNWTHVIWYNK
jgi:hypothetical protein